MLHYVYIHTHIYCTHTHTAVFVYEMQKHTLAPYWLPAVQVINPAPSMLADGTWAKYGLD